MPVCPFCGHAKGNYGFFAPNVAVFPMHKTLLPVWISSVMVHSKVVFAGLLISATEKRGFFGATIMWKPQFGMKIKHTKGGGGCKAPPLPPASCIGPPWSMR